MNPSGQGPAQDASTIAASMAANPGGLLIEPICSRPEKVAIVCLGGSMHDFVREAMMTQKFKNPYDEVWTLNRGIASIKHDKLFAMDDLRWLAKRDNAYGEFLKKHDRPIITSTVYPEFPNAIEYPYAQVIAKLQDDVFNQNTVAYMVAYALFTEVKEICIFGADFVYPNGNFAEAGGQAVAFLLGLAKFYGMTYKIPQSSTLLYCHQVKNLGNGVIGRPPYGYHRRDELSKEEQGIPLHAAG